MLRMRLDTTPAQLHRCVRATRSALAGPELAHATHVRRGEGGPRAPAAAAHARGPANVMPALPSVAMALPSYTHRPSPSWRLSVWRCELLAGGGSTAGGICGGSPGHARKSPRPATRRAAENLQRVGGKILGVVLNDLDVRELEYDFGYYYHRAEGDAEPIKISADAG